MTGVSESMRVVASDSCLSTTIDGESVVLQTDEGTYYGFNEVGTHVWESLQKPRTVEELCREVCHEYEVEYEQCQRDVKQLLEELVEKGLVRRTDEHQE